MLIAILYHFFNRTHIACAKVCLKPRVAANHLCKLRFGIFAAAAQRHQRRHLYRAAALRAEAGIVVAVHIYAAALVKQPNAYPAAKVLHYAEEIFEGLKAYRTADGSIQLFRPDCNIERMNNSAERMCLPQIPAELAMAGITELVKLERDWVPTEKDTSLYIRPFMIGLDPALGVHASHHVQFIVIVCPVGAYYPEGLAPVKIYVEQEDVRAVKGGTGMAKTGGNYAASLRAGDRAEKAGYSQVLWLDGVHRKYIEEVGAMNVMFKINGKILTPDLNGSVLPGVTRRSCIQLLKDWGYEVEERRISAEELFEAVWKEKYLQNGNNTVMAHIARLREKMNEPPRNPKFIKTVWGVGYEIE